MDCPVCRKPLIVVERDGIELDSCPACRGLWFDAGELALLAQKAGRALELEERSAPAGAGPEERPRSCPRCDRRMESVQLGAAPRVVADRCRSGHGLWFDQGELGSLVRQMPAERGSSPAALLRFLGETLAPGAGAPGASPATNVSSDGEEDR